MSEDLPPTLYLASAIGGTCGLCIRIIEAKEVPSFMCDGKWRIFCLGKEVDHAEVKIFDAEGKTI